MRETAVVEKYRKRLESSFLDFHLLDSHDFCGLDDGGLLVLERVRLHSLSFIRIINNVLSFAKFLGPYRSCLLFRDPSLVCSISSMLMRNKTNSYLFMVNFLHTIISEDEVFFWK